MRAISRFASSSNSDCTPAIVAVCISAHCLARSRRLAALSLSRASVHESEELRWVRLLELNDLAAPALDGRPVVAPGVHGAPNSAMQQLIAAQDEVDVVGWSISHHSVRSWWQCLAADLDVPNAHPMREPPGAFVSVALEDVSDMPLCHVLVDIPGCVLEAGCRGPQHRKAVVDECTGVLPSDFPTTTKVSLQVILVQKFLPESPEIDLAPQGAVALDVLYMFLSAPCQRAPAAARCLFQTAGTQGRTHADSEPAPSTLLLRRTLARHCRWRQRCLRQCC